MIDNHPEYKGSEIWKEGNADVSYRQRISKEALIPVLTKAVQELSAQVTTLQQEIKTLKEGN